MTPDQRTVWFALRLRGLVQDIVKLKKEGREKFAKDYLRDFIIEQNLDVDLEVVVESALMGYYAWHIAEEEAIAYYEAF